MRPTGRDGGFTLLELMLVLAVLGLGATVIVPAFGSRAGASSAIAARDLVTALRSARAVALSGGRPVTFDVVSQPTAAGVTLRAVGDGPAAVTFFPDGGATAARFVVLPGGQVVAVDWLTGAVTRAE